MAEDRFQGNTIAIVCSDPKILLVQSLAKHFQGQFFHVVTESDEVGAMSRALDPDTALIVFTPGFPGTPGLISRFKARPRSAGTPVLRLISPAEARQLAGVFRQLADAEIREPCEFSAITSAAMDLVAESRARIGEQSMVYRWVFPAETRWMDEAFEAAAMSFSNSGLDDSSQIKLCAALREAVGATLRLSKRPEPGAEIKVAVSTGVRGVEVLVVAPAESSPWLGGKDDPWVASRSYSLALMRQCVDDVKLDANGGFVRLLKHPEAKQ
jgi:DNA-binding response OmpR family regulator